MPVQPGAVEIERNCKKCGHTWHVVYALKKTRKKLPHVCPICTGIYSTPVFDDEYYRKCRNNLKP